MKKLPPCLLCIIAFSFLLISSAQAQTEEFAPGFDFCMQKAGTSFGMREQCWKEASDYWNNQVIANYKEAEANCNNKVTPNECQAQIKKAQESWLQYREALEEYLSMMEKGMDQPSLKKTEILTSATRRHAQSLKIK